ncbi:hypothetical protein GS399_05420 [Pedobacter sp. HMF7647]|uniref:Uncharacterized protein n=1 Tax=Hufsiella arboris TaxID=2695275 RepID=A0A7K1Y766_9SPHI|nr:hypothetical protein [Hufsiella arboris]MXV50405.1 hypothetical protein [Hufsiella arboris]
MKKLLLSVPFVFFLLHFAEAQNSPLLIWGAGLDGSMYQASGIYSTSAGLLLEAPLLADNSKTPIELNWRGSGSSPFKILPNGNIGMGTSSPAVKLDMKGDGDVVSVRIAQNSEVPHFGLEFGQKSNLDDFISGSGRNLQVTSGWGNTLLLGSPEFNQYGGKVIIPGGNVGIGTLNPDAKLAVKGTLHASEVKVDLYVPVPDYVFNEDYDLRPLASVRSYIDANRHLPEIPSAAEIEKNGMNVGEMNMLLLKKVEELTLYVLELKKENEDQNKKILQQNQKIKLLGDSIVKNNIN